MKIIIDFDRTLTAEESQVGPLSENSLKTLASEILGVLRRQLVEECESTRECLLRAPYRHWWEVNGLAASYCDEGAFILNTTTLQVMLRKKPNYLPTVTAAFRRAEYDPVVDCTNYVFHRHSAELSPAFRPCAGAVLSSLIAHPHRTPVVLTNSLGDKVRRHLRTLELDEDVAVLRDTRQCQMDPDWQKRFSHPDFGDIQIWPACEHCRVDLCR